MPPPVDSEQSMRQALDRFRDRMAAANWTFIQDRIHEIEARGLLTDKQRMSKMASYCRHFDALDWDEVSEDADPETRQKENRLRQTRRLEDIPGVSDAFPFAMDGIHPPRLRTDKARELFLETLQEVFQQQAEEWATETGEEAPGPIPKCHELGVFLKYAHAVVDPDFRRAGIAPFEAGLEVLGVHEADLAETQPERYYELVQEECARVRENLEDDELSDLVNKSLIAPNLEVDNLEVKAGVITGTGYVDEYPQWYSTYLYCRRRVDADENKDNIPDAPNIHDWGWRVVFLDAEPVSYLTPLVLYGRKPRFDSIPEFLDWYCTWPDHLDARGILSLRRHANRCETDCESDCEIHNFAPAPFPPGYGEKQCI